MTDCPICGNQFEDAAGHRGEKKFCSLKCYWKSKRVDSGYKKAACIDCGSDEIFKHGVHNIAIKVCKKCFDERWKKLNHDKNFYKKKAICSGCGIEMKTPETYVKKYHIDGILCINCRTLTVKHCRCCGLVFDRYDYSEYCSNECREKYDVWFKKYTKYFYKDFTKKLCVDCGIELNEQTRSHKKSDQQCNECNYIARRLRKDKAIYGEEYLGIIGQTRLIDSIEINFKKSHQGGTLCHGNKLNWEKVMKRLENLFRSERSKTSLNSILARSTE